MDDFPPLVARARSLARQAGFPLTRQEAAGAGPSASLPGVGRFLAMLAAGCSGGRIGEMGTGVGIGTAWMASAMPDDCTLITAEIDPERAGAARKLLAEDRRVEVEAGVSAVVLSGRDRSTCWSAMAAAATTRGWLAWSASAGGSSWTTSPRRRRSRRIRRCAAATP